MHPNVAKLKLLVEPSWQKYGDLPPGKGRAVVYVGVNTINGMMYVGKHKHGIQGLPCSQSRWKQHARGGLGTSRRIHNALNFYGKDAFQWFILEHIPEELALEYEDYWISSRGLNTLSPNGYNLVAAVESGGFSNESLARMSAAQKKRWEDPKAHEKQSKLAFEVQNDAETRQKQSQSKLKQRNDRLAACTTENEVSQLKKRFLYLDKLGQQHKDNKDMGRPKLPIGSKEKCARRQELAMKKREDRLNACPDEYSKAKLVAHFAKLDARNLIRAKQGGYPAMN